MEQPTSYTYRDKPILHHCVEGHELEGHTIRLVGFGEEVFTITYAGWMDPQAGGDQWLVYDAGGVEMLRVGVAEMIPYLIEE